VVPEIKVDARQALAKFSRAGIPESVRNALRRTLPDLGKLVGARVEHALDTQLKSRQNLRVTKEMRENPTQITARVAVTWVGDPKKRMVPQWLESGTRPHEIWATGARGGAGPKALFFYWEKIGANFIGPRVFHPGFKGIQYMETTMALMEPQIVDVIKKAAIDGAKSA